MNDKCHSILEYFYKYTASYEDGTGSPLSQWDFFFFFPSNPRGTQLPNWMSYEGPSLSPFPSISMRLAHCN